MNTSEMVEQFVKKYGDKAVWQVDSLLFKLAEAIKLDCQLPLFQGGTSRDNIQKQIDTLEQEIFHRGRNEKLDKIRDLFFKTHTDQFQEVAKDESTILFFHPYLDITVKAYLNDLGKLIVQQI